MGFLDNIFSRGKAAEKSPGKRRPAENGSAFIITFRLSEKKPLDKVKFCQALFGRKSGSGALAGLGGKKLGNGCVLVPASGLQKIDAFMRSWNVQIQKQKIILAE